MICQISRPYEIEPRSGQNVIVQSSRWMLYGSLNKSKLIISILNLICGALIIISILGVQPAALETTSLSSNATSKLADRMQDRNISLRTTEATTTRLADDERGESAKPTESSEESRLNDENEDENLDEDEKDEGAENPKKLLGTLSEMVNEASDKIVDKLRGSESSIASDDSDSNDEESSTQSSSSEPKAEFNSLLIHNLGFDKEAQRSARSQPDLNVNLTASNSTKDVLVMDQRESNELKFALETYTQWRSASDEMIELFSRKLLPILMEHGYEVDGTTVSGLLQVFNGVRALKPWALKLLDASAKLSPGILVGTQSDFGDFDECLSIRSDDPSGLAGSDSSIPVELDPVTGLKSSTLIGKYCLADIEFPKPPRKRLATRNEELQTDFAPVELRQPLYNFSDSAAFKETIFVETGNFFHMLYVDPLRVGICLTNKIDSDSFATVFNKIFKEFQVTINFRGRCVTKYDRPTWTKQQIISSYVLLTVSFLVIISTALDIIHSRLHKIPISSHWKERVSTIQSKLQRFRPLFTSFSIIRNTQRLFKRQISAKLSSSESQNNQDLDSSSPESSPSIERRSSAANSACGLITKPAFPLLEAINSHKNRVEKQQQVSTRDPCNSGLSNSLGSLHGIRVITMAWMIVNHTYMFGGFFVLWAHRRLIDIAEWPKSISFQLVLNGWLTVETYFFLSAMIIVLNVMPLMKANKFAYLAYVIHRLFRLIPAYVGLVCLNFIWPLVSSGPIWMVKGKKFIEWPCENYLWANFLFINNWIWPEKQCMVHTWFLSADFQLYLLAPIVVYLFYRRPVFGHTLNIVCAILASIISGLAIYANKLLPTTLINKLEFDSIKLQLSYSYFATYQHIGPYCLGLFIGYILHKRPGIKLPTHLSWLLWLLLPPLSFTTLLLTYLWNGAYGDPDLINPSPLVSAFYVAIHRTIWTSLVAWLVFACATGRARLLSSFLSHSIFVPLSRLSFSIYLVHMPIIMYRALNNHHTIEWTDSNIIWEAGGNFIASMVIGYALNIAFESPLMNIEQLIFGRPKIEAPSSRASLRTEITSDATERHSNTSKSSLNNESCGKSNKSTDGASSDECPDNSIESKDANDISIPRMASFKGLRQFGTKSTADGVIPDGLQEPYKLSEANNAADERHSYRLIPRLNSGSGYERPAQYATIARMSQLHNHEGPTNEDLRYKRNFDRLDAWIRSRQKSSVRESGNQSSRHLQLRSTGRFINIREKANHLSRKRHHRYNTMSGLGAAEWQVGINSNGSTDFVDGIYRPMSLVDEQTSETGPGNRVGTNEIPWKPHRPPGSNSYTNWTNNFSGYLIPRASSSTLRRSVQPVDSVEESIAEEPSNEDLGEQSL